MEAKRRAIQTNTTLYAFAGEQVQLLRMAKHAHVQRNTTDFRLKRAQNHTVARVIIRLVDVGANVTMKSP